MPMNLQLFAEPGDGAGADDGAGGGTEGAGAGTSGGDAGTGGDNREGDPGKPKTFDEILKEGNYQAEFDRRIQKALGTAKDKWSALMDDKLSEAEKLAKMNKEEKADYMRQKQEKDLAAREADITKRELMAEAKNTLVEKKLPASLAEILNYTDADTCKTSLEAVEKAFQEAVQTAVEEKLKGGIPPKKAPQGDAAALEKQVEALMMGQ